MSMVEAPWWTLPPRDHNLEILFSTTGLQDAPVFRRQELVPQILMAIPDCGKDTTANHSTIQVPRG